MLQREAVGRQDLLEQPFEGILAELAAKLGTLEDVL
jgi:hypothetical protein